MCPPDVFSHVEAQCVKPQYENWCNCCVVSLFSLWVTLWATTVFFARSLFFSGRVSSLFFALSLFFWGSAPSLFCYVTLFSLPSPLFHAHLLSVTLSAAPLLISPCSHSLCCSLCRLSLPPSLSPPVRYSLDPLQPQRPDLLPPLGEREGLLSATSSGHMAPCRGWQQDWRTCSLGYPPSQACMCVLGINCMWVAEQFVCVYFRLRKFLLVCSQVCFSALLTYIWVTWIWQHGWQCRFIYMLQSRVKYFNSYWIPIRFIAHIISCRGCYNNLD